jgi:hypothetical protein
MDRVMVTSSNVKGVGYDADTQTLEVEFLNGGVYQYAPVDKETYDEIVDPANSAGRIIGAVKKELGPDGCTRIDVAALAEEAS